MEGNLARKLLSFQQLTDYRCQLWYKYGINDLFDSYIIDENVEYMFKDFSVSWYSDIKLKTVYECKNLSLFLMFDFKSKDLPKRCEDYFCSITEEFYDHLKITKNRVSKVKLRRTVSLLLKNISRLKFHKRYALKYSKHKRNWVRVDKNYSLSYFLELIDFLSEKGHVKDFSGFGDRDSKYDNVMSMLLVNPNFIELCNGFGKTTYLDYELQSPDPPSTEIRVKVSKKDYKIIPPSKEEKGLSESVKDIMDQLNFKLRNTYIEIGNVTIPEYFLVRIYRDNMKSGGRIFDKSEIQGESEPARSTIKIDQEETVELDYKSLHYSMAAEELGIKLNGKDPYDFLFDLDTNIEEINSWKEEYNISEYNPVRNLKKTALLVMFNAKDKNSAIKGISDAIRKDFKRKDKATRRFVGIKNIPVTKLVESVIDNNKEVSEYFNSGVGLRFQNLDSEMIMECIKNFIEVDEVLLPVHDSIIIKKSLKNFGIKCMKDAYKKVMGSDFNCIIE